MKPARLNRFRWLYGFLPWLLAGVFPGAVGAELSPLGPEKAAAFELKDQFDVAHSISFPRTNLIVLMIADRKGSEQIHSWTAPLSGRYAGHIDIAGVADVSQVPFVLRGFVQAKFKKHYAYPVMLDWTGRITKNFRYENGQAGVFLIRGDGTVLMHLSGMADAEKIRRAEAVIDQALPATEP